MRRILIMAGGTGGHVFPALVMANYWRDQGIIIEWIGTKHGLESEVVPQAGFKLHCIEIYGLRGKSFKNVILSVKLIIVAVVQLAVIINRYKPDLVVGFGGFVSGPGGIASLLLRCPLVIHEQNAVFGLTNKLLSKIARKVLVGFPQKNCKVKSVELVGNPIRSEILQLPPPSLRLRRKGSSWNILILGGSLGAKALNSVLPSGIYNYYALGGAELNIYHQTGRNHVAETIAAYQELGIKANLIDFIADMSEAYRWADLVICRAGALTIAELCSVGLGSILVPFPYAADDHQTCNAKLMVENGASILIAQSQLTAQKLADILVDLTNNPHKILEMAEAAYAFEGGAVADKFNYACLGCISR